MVFNYPLIISFFSLPPSFQFDKRRCLCRRNGTCAHSAQFFIPYRAFSNIDHRRSTRFTLQRARAIRRRLIRHRKIMVCPHFDDCVPWSLSHCQQIIWKTHAGDIRNGSSPACTVSRSHNFCLDTRVGTPRGGRGLVEWTLVWCQSGLVGGGVHDAGERSHL